MKSSSYFVAPAILAALSILVGCSSDGSGGNSTAGAGPGGASGKAGSAGASAAGATAAGASSGGTAGSVAGGSSSSAGGGSGGASSAGGGSGGASTGGTSGGAAVEATFATVKSIIQASCFGAGCHSEMGNPLQMKVDASLYGTLTTHMTMNCGKMVDIANPADSALVKVLKGSCGTPPNVTPRMPFQVCMDGDTDPDSPCIQPDKIAAIQAWIAKGAPQQ